MQPIEYEPIMKKLIKTVVRAFYEPHHIVIMDILLENTLLSDDEFCDKMKMLSREFNKLIMRLKDDRLLKHDVKIEVKDDNKQMLKTVYFINYAEVRDIIKYKIYKMRTMVDQKVQISDKNFYCPLCGETLSTLDAQVIIRNFAFMCLKCDCKLEENKAEKVEGGIDTKGLINSLEPIIILLRQAETHKIPNMDYFQVLELKREKESIVTEAKSEEQVYQKQEEEKQIDDNDEEFDDVDFTKESMTEPSKAVTDFVFVNGKQKAYNEITEDDKDNMTEDEYIKYFEIYSKYN